MPKGRPTNDPSGKKRVKLQPWVHPDTQTQVERDARIGETTIGHIFDKWAKDRATQNTKTLAPMKPNKDTPNTEPEPPTDLI